MKVLVAQLWPTLCNTMDCSLSASSVHGIFQARILEWIAIPFSRGSSQPRNRTQVSCIASRFFTVWATGEWNVAWFLGGIKMCLFHFCTPIYSTRLGSELHSYFSKWVSWVSNECAFILLRTLMHNVMEKIISVLDFEGERWGGLETGDSHDSVLWVFFLMPPKYHTDLYFIGIIVSLSTYWPTPVFLPGESQGQESLVDWCLWGHTESDTTEVT